MMPRILVTLFSPSACKKEWGDLQHTGERCHHKFFVAVIYVSHLALKITDVVLEALLGFHFDGEEVIVLLLEFARETN